MAKPTVNGFHPRRDQFVGLLAEFPHPGALYEATKDIRKKGYARFDTYSPFPIHGMDKAMGMGPSLLGYIVFVGSVTGVSLALLMQWWMNAVDYPINISGKPLFALETSVPITFELMVIFSAVTAVAGMLALNGLPRPYNPLFFSERFSRVTDDKFFLHVQALDPQFSREQTAEALYSLGALHVEYISHEGAQDVPRAGVPATPPSTPTA